MADKLSSPAPAPPAAVDAACPVCAGRSLHIFYELTGVPVQSNLLFATAADARGCPTGQLRLAYCTSCSFMANVAFDAATQQLSARYEATQGFSPTFNTFAKSLAARWIDRYQLAGKAVIEIGCGRGEFISMLCQMADCRGVGIDPGVTDEQLADTAGPVRWIKDFYSPRYANLPADFICCRHTLEHIPDVARFLSMLRGVIGGRTGVVVGFEVPDTLRVLQEGAFWDLYYEHCSYFCEATLARAFEHAGLEVISLTREYDRQYLVIEARPGAATALQPGAMTASIQAAIDKFPRICADRIATWRQQISQRRAHGQRIVLWGAGSKAVGFLSTLGPDAQYITAVVDINPHKQNTYLPATAQPIVAPTALRADPPNCVIVMNPIYRDEIETDLRRIGIWADVLTL